MQPRKSVRENWFLGDLVARTAQKSSPGEPALSGVEGGDPT